nr:glutathione S-transferase [uncultured Roseateles sp.]
MITLCGFSASNYYNKVKMVLLEKGIPFEEEMVKTGSTDEAVLNCTPLAKVPFIRTEQGAMCESQAIADYLELAYPQPALLPADPWAAGKVRELVVYVDWHLEMVARQLYYAAYFGGTISDEAKEKVRLQLVKNIAAFKRLAKFSPYLAGDTFTQADVAAWVSLPLISMSTKAMYGEDLLTAGGIDWKPYAKMIGERASAQKITADRKTDQEKAAAAKT